MKHSFKPLVSIIAVSILVAGCAHSDSTDKALATIQWPEQWQQGSVHPTSSAVTDPNQTAADWWTLFNDPQLNQLIERARARNNTLAVAGYKLRQAQLSAGLAQNDMFPSISASGSSSASRAFNQNDGISRSSRASLSVSYEIDLWGKLARAYDAKSWEAQATEQDLRSTELTIEGTVAKLYWQLAYLNQRLAFADASLAYARKTLDLINVQYRAGAASKLDVLTAERSVSSQEASRTDLIQERNEARNAMAIMFDAPPNAHIDNEPQALPTTELPAVVEGLPAEILARRPDLSAAELRLRKSLANIDVARANFYPSFSLTGSLGTGSTSLTKILSDPVGALALNLALPFLNWNENQLNLKVSKSSYDQAVVEFRQTLYTAMSDVENALSARTQYALKAAQLQKAWESAKESERLYEVRYRAGASSLKDWLDAQEARRQAQSNLITNQYNQYVNQVTLSLALGG